MIDTLTTVNRITSNTIIAGEYRIIKSFIISVSQQYFILLTNS